MDDVLTIGSLSGGSLLALNALVGTDTADAGPAADRRRAEQRQQAMWTGAAGVLLLLYGARRARWI